MEAYNHWILMKGDEDAFGIWMNSNKEKWDNFVKWFTDNGLKSTNQINSTECNTNDFKIKPNEKEVFYIYF